ncbi:hypothetical protein CRE_14159 [Caenorhabditis remanei]|uniref:Uncharacterized protein n=1 Tax=Caenorhabditis remanei TaxID=31234 RepID=E3MRK5_CAERE|nr:hypothetical protein CRE_14159 [Caenorhabditis remanei]
MDKNSVVHVFLKRFIESLPNPRTIKAKGERSDNATQRHEPVVKTFVRHPMGVEFKGTYRTMKAVLGAKKDKTIGMKKRGISGGTIN